MAQKAKSTRSCCENLDQDWKLLLLCCLPYFHSLSLSSSHLSPPDVTMSSAIYKLRSNVRKALITAHTHAHLKAYRVWHIRVILDGPFFSLNERSWNRQEIQRGSVMTGSDVITDKTRITIIAPNAYHHHSKALSDWWPHSLFLHSVSFIMPQVLPDWNYLREWQIYLITPLKTKASPRNKQSCLEVSTEACRKCELSQRKQCRLLKFSSQFHSDWWCYKALWESAMQK